MRSSATTYRTVVSLRMHRDWNHPGLTLQSSARWLSPHHLETLLPHRRIRCCDDKCRCSFVMDGRFEQPEHISNGFETFAQIIHRWITEVLDLDPYAVGPFHLFR